MMMMMNGPCPVPPVLRPDPWGTVLNVPLVTDIHGSGSYMEKRQVFLRSYHFSRKKSSLEKMRGSAVRIRRIICIPLRAARGLPRLLWYRLRCAWYGRSRRGHRFRFQRLTSAAPAH